MLQLDKQNLQAFIDAIPTPVFVKDKSSRPVMVNSSACGFYGFTREQILHGDSGELFSPARAKGFRETDERVLSTGDDLEYEEKARDASGTVKTFVTRKRLMKGLDGEPLIVGVASDISALREVEDHYRYSVILNPQVPWTAGPDGAIDEAGPRWEQLTGMPAVQARGAGWIESLHPADVAQTLVGWKQALANGSDFDVEYRIRIQDGSYRWFRARASARRDRDGQIIRWYGTLEDIHQRKLAERHLQESEERFRLAARAARLGVWDYDAVERRRSCTPELKEMLGLPATAPVDPDLVRDLIHEDDRQQFDDLSRAAANRDAAQEFTATFRFRRANDGEERWVETDGWKVIEGGKLARVVITVRDITDERLADERLLWAATRDLLTSLPNRMMFQERMNSALEEARHTGGKVGLLLLDVDNLKQINDTLGHEAGDELLKLFAERLEGALRSGDTAARLGGDEFAVILPNLSRNREVALIASRIIDTLREPFRYKTKQVTIRPSVGASHFPAHGAELKEILRAADLALYTAKATARGSLVVFNSRMNSQERRQNALIASARQAMRDDRIFPFYQAKVELGTSRITGFEALLRWRRTTGAVQGPSSILAAFSDHELASMVRDRMLVRIFSDMRHWLDCGVDFGSVAINAGDAELRSERFSDHLLENLSQKGIPTSLIQLEVVESVFVGRGSEQIETTLRNLCQEGISIALDDFGTGYASLTHLNKYPVDVVKIDRSFVQDMEANPGNAAIVGAVVNLGRNLGISVVAEGVERREQVDLLRTFGCEFGQGYLFSKPIPAKRVPELLAGQSSCHEFPPALSNCVYRPAS